MPDAIALERVQHPGYVAVLVIEDRPDDAFGKLAFDVIELLARLIPSLALVRFRRAAPHADRHAPEALARKRDDFLEMVELLELLLHAVEHLVLDLLGRGARPVHHGRHRRHREVRVFEVTEPAA